MSTFYVQLNFLGCFNFCFPLILFSSEPFDLKKVISGKKVSMFWHLAGTGDIKSNDGKAKAAETGHSRQTKQVMFILVYLKNQCYFTHLRDWIQSELFYLWNEPMILANLPHSTQILPNSNNYGGILIFQGSEGKVK